MDIKICANCKHYTGSLCKKFYETNLVTGEKSYYYANYLRETEKCGESAIHFEKNPYKNRITFPYYFVKHNKLPCMLIGGCFSYVSFLYYLSKKNKELVYDDYYSNNNRLCKP